MRIFSFRIFLSLMPIIDSCNPALGQIKAQKALPRNNEDKNCNKNITIAPATTPINPA
jgi:hypothetical protein